MTLNIKPTLFLIFVLIIGNIKAQKPLIDKYEEKIKYINSLTDSIKKAPSDSVRLKLNNKIKISLTEIIKQKQSFQSKLDSLKKIGKIFSPDNKFRLFSWNIPLINGTHEYSAIIQFNPEKDSICKLAPLKDISRTFSGILYEERFTPNNWYGALYYQILPIKTEKGTVYTLLGLHFNDLFTTKKIIEAMSISQDGFITFGVPIFSYNNRIQKRIIFEYGVDVIMNLKFDTHLNMIIFDHLAPSSPLYSNNFKFYGPDFTFDGLKFENEKWIYYPNINFHKWKKQ